MERRGEFTPTAFRVTAKSWGPGVRHTWVQIPSLQLPTATPWVSQSIWFSLGFLSFRQMTQGVPSHLQGYYRMMSEVPMRTEIYSPPLLQPPHTPPHFTRCGALLSRTNNKYWARARCPPAPHSEKHLASLLSSHDHPQAGSLVSHFTGEKLSHRAGPQVTQLAVASWTRHLASRAILCTTFPLHKF